MKRYMKCEVLDIPEIANAFCFGSRHFNPLIQTARKQYGHDGMRIDSKAVNSPRNVKLSADVAPVTCVSYALRRPARPAGENGGGGREGGGADGHRRVTYYEAAVVGVLFVGGILI